jgi:hypothetical protein
MNYSFITSKKLDSTFKAEDYFPAIIQFSTEELNNRFIEFSYHDTDMFELVANSTDGTIKQFTLTLCNHFEEHNEFIDFPDSIEGTIALLETSTIECEKFILLIYKNGLRIDISEKKATKHLKCGQLIFSFDESNSLVTLYVTGLSTEDISHVLQEVHM